MTTITQQGPSPAPSFCSSNALLGGAANTCNKSKGAAGGGNNGVPTPPSSFCGSDLFNTIDAPIHKFFNQTKKDLCCDSIDVDDDGTMAGSLVDRSSVNNDAAQDAKKSLKSPLPVDADLTPKQTNKFSCFKCEPSVSTAEDDDGAAKATGGVNIKQPKFTLPREEVGRQSKFSFWTQRDGKSSAFINLEQPSGSNVTSPTDNKKVKFVPIIDPLFEASADSAEACSFASSLTSFSSQKKRCEVSGLSSANAYGKLASHERRNILYQCRAYRMQITTFEDTFVKEHGRPPSTNAEKSNLSSVYRQYREGKRAIRGDAASRIQALCRRFVIRSRYAASLSKKRETTDAAAVAVAIQQEPETIKEMAQKNIRELHVLKSTLTMTQQAPSKDWTTSDIVNDIAAMLSTERQSTKNMAPRTPGASTTSSAHGGRHQTVLTQEMITEYLTDDERRQIATKALSSKLVEKDIKLPNDSDASGAICNVCEMPKLASAETGIILENCVVCDKLHKKIAKKRIKEEKARERMLEQQEGEKLEMLQQEMEDRRQPLEFLKLTNPEHVERYEMMRQWNEDMLLRAMNGELNGGGQYRSAAMDWSLSVPSTLHLPVAVKANQRHANTCPDAADTSGSSSQEDEEGGGKHYEFGADKSKDGSFDTAKQDHSPIKEKDEFDDLIDDESIEKLQRKLRNCPSPTESEAAAAKAAAAEREEEKEKLESPPKKGTPEKKQGSSSSQFDEFQQMYDKFVGDHSDVVDYVRDRVGGKSDRKMNRGHHRSSSMPSLSSLDEDSRDHYEGRYYGGRHRGYRRHPPHISRGSRRRGGHHYGRRREYRDYRDDDYSSDSVSELSVPYYEDERYYRHHHRHHSHRGYGSRGRRHGGRPRKEYRGGEYRHHSSSYGRRSHPRHRDVQRSYSSDDYSSSYSVPRPVDKAVDRSSNEKELLFNKLINSGAMKGKGNLHFDFDYGK